MSTLVNPPQAMPFDGLVNPTVHSDHQNDKFAPVICYCKAGEIPTEFRIATKKNFFSLAGDLDFLNDTEFLEAPFKVYDTLATQFISIPPSVYWRYPSEGNPFFLVKNASIENKDCPGLQDLVNILLDATATHFDNLPRMPANSPTPTPSPPPPAQPPKKEYVEQTTQTVGKSYPKKRKRSDSQAETKGPAKKARAVTLNVNIHLHIGREGCSVKEASATGDSEANPIVL